MITESGYTLTHAQVHLVACLLAALNPDVDSEEGYRLIAQGIDEIPTEDWHALREQLANELRAHMDITEDKPDLGLHRFTFDNDELDWLRVSIALAHGTVARVDARTGMALIGQAIQAANRIGEEPINSVRDKVLGASADRVHVVSSVDEMEAKIRELHEHGDSVMQALHDMIDNALHNPDAPDIQGMALEDECADGDHCGCEEDRCCFCGRSKSAARRPVS